MKHDGKNVRVHIYPLENAETSAISALLFPCSSPQIAQSGTAHPPLPSIATCLISCQSSVATTELWPTFSASCFLRNCICLLSVLYQLKLIAQKSFPFESLPSAVPVDLRFTSLSSQSIRTMSSTCLLPFGTSDLGTLDLASRGLSTAGITTWTTWRLSSTP
jgi:hypothetical protein